MQAAGCREVINYSNESIKDRIKEITGGKGVDVVYDPVGGDFAELLSQHAGMVVTIIGFGLAYTQSCSI